MSAPTVRKWLASTTWRLTREREWEEKVQCMEGVWLIMLQTTTLPLASPDTRNPPSICVRVGGGSGEGEREGKKREGGEREKGRREKQERRMQKGGGGERKRKKRGRKEAKEEEGRGEGRRGAEKVKVKEKREGKQIKNVK